ncbi:MAG: uL4 family ribosomal protein, partial [Candidatus Parcubacteria bacterium]|nr:uL4 family ribosomal protein [Candidatus Parcubacteria bacterium]
PRNERNYTQKINKKVQHQVLLMALSDKAANSRLVIVDNFNLAAEKTKEFAKLLKSLPIKDQKCLLAYQPSEAMIHRVAKNIASVTTIPVQNINLRQLLDADYVLMSQAALKDLEGNLKK